ESRLFFVDKLIGMGARIVLCDPHRAVIAGPSALRGQQVESPDIRAGMAMLLAALAAQGDSVIQNIGQIERGYEHIDDRLRALGAQTDPSPCCSGATCCPHTSPAPARRGPKPRRRRPSSRVGGVGAAL